MWRCSDFSVHLRAELSNGFYLFSEQSLGKSYLTKLIKRYEIQNVVAYSYEDYQNAVDLAELLTDKVKLVVVDRYDRFGGYCLSDLVNQAKKSIVLVDWKQMDGGEEIQFEASVCKIELKENLINIIPDSRFIEQSKRQCKLLANIKGLGVLRNELEEFF